jgi:hypothetical protein
MCDAALADLLCFPSCAPIIQQLAMVQTVSEVPTVMSICSDLVSTPCARRGPATAARASGSRATPHTPRLRSGLARHGR